MSNTDEICNAIIQARHEIILDEVKCFYFTFFIFECGVLAASIGWQYSSWFLFIISLLAISILFWIPVTRLFLALSFSAFWTYCAYWVCQWFSLESSKTTWCTVLAGMFILGLHYVALDVLGDFQNEEATQS